jgi:hypothetical protein
VQSVEKSINDARTELGRANKRLEDAKTALDALAVPEPIDHIEAEIAVLSAWTDWKLGQQNLARYREEIAAEEKTVETWEWLVAKFGAGPGSYRAELLDGKLGALEAAVNEALLPLLGEKIVFPVGDVPLSIMGEGYTYAANASHLSGSEKLRLSIALQYGLCKALGFPLLLVDCEAALDASSTGQILGFCKQVAETWPEVQMLVAMAPARTTWREDFPVEAFDEWADVWAVEDGKTQRMTTAPEEVDH